MPGADNVSVCEYSSPRYGRTGQRFIPVRRLLAPAGNTKFKKAFQTLMGTSLRVVHSGDPIPNFPFWRCVPPPRVPRTCSVNPGVWCESPVTRRTCGHHQCPVSAVSDRRAGRMAASEELPAGSPQVPPRAKRHLPLQRRFEDAQPALVPQIPRQRWVRST